MSTKDIVVNKLRTRCQTLLTALKVLQGEEARVRKQRDRLLNVVNLVQSEATWPREFEAMFSNLIQEVRNETAKSGGTFDKSISETINSTEAELASEAGEGNAQA